MQRQNTVQTVDYLTLVDCFVVDFAAVRWTFQYFVREMTVDYFVVVAAVDHFVMKRSDLDVAADAPIDN